MDEEPLVGRLVVLVVSVVVSTGTTIAGHWPADKSWIYRDEPERRAFTIAIMTITNGKTAEDMLCRMVGWLIVL